MKISILHKKILNLGDHGEYCYQSIEPKENETVEQLIERLLTEDNPTNFMSDRVRNENYSEVIELRISKP